MPLVLYISEALFIAGYTAATVSSIMANESLFRLSIVSAFLTKLSVQMDRVKGNSNVILELIL